MQAFLNERSLPNLHTPSDVVIMFSQLGECYKEASIYGVKEIKIHSTFYNHEFAPNYRYFNWLDDNNADGDLKTLLKSVLGTVPFIDDIFSQYQTENEIALTMKIDGQVCLGLGLASETVFNTISFSYDQATWTQANYTISVSTLLENEAEELEEVEESSTAKNISSISHCGTHKAFINTKVANSILNGRELWLRRGDLFPNLQFCSSVQNQISDMRENTLGFSQIIGRLFDLQNTAAKCDGNPIKPADFSYKTTRESATRLRDFKEQLTIMCPDGNIRLFDWHSRYTPGAGRIHFVPFEEGKYFLVGSIANQNSIK